jgi:ribonuclease E
MLEIERQNRESADGATESGRSAGTSGSAGDSDSQSGGQLRRPRRAVTRPAGPPAAELSAPVTNVGGGASGHAEAGPGSGTGDSADGAPRKRQSRSRGAKAGTADSETAATAGATSSPPASAPAASTPADGGTDLPDSGGSGGAAAGGTTTRRRASSRTRAASQTAPPEHEPDRHEPGRPEAGQRGAGQHDFAGQDEGRGPSGQAASPPAAPPGPVAFQPPLVIFQAPEIPATHVTPTQKPPRQQPVAASAGRSADADADVDADAADSADGREEGGQGPSSRRRRRGGRGRGKSGPGTDGADSTGPAATDDQAELDRADGDGSDQDDDGTEDAGTAKRRRRRRRSGSASDAEQPAAAVSADDPPNTVTHVRTPREKTADVTDVRAIKGSTRLEAKRQRRREGRESGRRRPPIITESEFLARREAVERVMVVRQHADRTQIAVLEDGVLVEHYVDKASHQSYVGNVYLGKVQNVLPSMEAAFVDIGKGRNAVLYAGEVNFDASGLEGESKRIESALKSGQSILVQVTKDPIGHKGARLTSQVSLPGRYLVYVPGASMTGISRKLPDTERSRLKQILKQVMPEHAGVIVRTAAEGASEEELARDVARLAAQWEAIEKKAKTASAPDLLYSEPDLTLRVVRDIFNEDFSSLIIASDSEWDLVDEYVRYVAPHLADRMQRWDDADDVFAAYRIDEQLAKALERKVWLPSGGSLVIDHTEAMTVIDVNTGKFTGQGGNLEQTVTRNNLEAAEEIVRQLRLRDLGGIIVIDFIDMVLESNRELVLRRLLECLARDRTKHQVAEVTSLGLVQMTRKRVGSGLLEAFSVPCEHCNGRGVIISLEPVDHSHGRDSGGRDSSGRDGSGRDSSSQDGGGKSSHGGRNRSGNRSGGSATAANAGGPPVPGPAASSTRQDSARQDSSSEQDTARQDSARQEGSGQDAAMPGDQALAASAAADSGAGASTGRSSRSRSGRSRAPAAAVDQAADGSSPQASGTSGPASGGPGPDGTGPVGAGPDGAGRDGAEATQPGSAGLELPGQDGPSADGAAPASGGSRPGRSRSGRGRRSRAGSQDAAEAEPAASHQAVEPANS